MDKGDKEMNRYLEKLMYDSSNRLDSYTTSFSRRLIFEGERYVKDQIFNSLKIKYGKEIIVKNNSSDSKIWKWLKDHDPKFNKQVCLQIQCILLILIRIHLLL